MWLYVRRPDRAIFAYNARSYYLRSTVLSLRHVSDAIPLETGCTQDILQF